MKAHQISSPETYLQQKIQHKYNFSSSKASKAVLLKYHLKYIPSISFDQDSPSKSYPILTKLRQIKITHSFKGSFGRFSHQKQISLTENLLQNKRRSIKAFPLLTSNTQIRPYFITKLSSFFPNIQCLDSSTTLHFKENSNSSTIIKSYRYLCHALRHLQSLKITISSPIIWPALQTTQSSLSKGFLSSLKSLHLEITPPDSTTIATTQVFFQDLLKHKTLLKHATHVTFHTFKDFQYFGDQVKTILDSCSKLISLSFPVEKQLYSLPKSKQKLTLIPLHSFHQIRMLNLQVNDPQNFFEIFDFPLSLNTLFLNFPEEKVNWLEIWRLLIGVKNKKGFSNGILSTFLERFTRLNSLKFLQLILPNFTVPNQIIQDFVRPLLGVIPNLEKFDFQLYQDPQNHNNSPLDLSGLFNDFVVFKKLKSFNISQPSLNEEKSSPNNQDLAITFTPHQPCYLPPHLNIDAWILPEFDFKQFFQLLNKNPQTKEICFSKIYLNSLDSFLKFLKQIKAFQQCDSLKIRLEIILFLTNLTDIQKRFESPIILTKNFTISLDIYVPFYLNAVYCKEGLKAFQNTFQNFRLNVHLSNLEYARFVGSVQMNYTQVIQNNFLCV